MKLKPEQVREMIQNASKMEIELVWISTIMKWQTEEEQRSKATLESNGKGLSACDAGKITWYFNIIKRGQTLSEEQLADARKRLLKYSKQYAMNTV